MKILLIDNDVFVQKEDSLCVFKTTGEFAVELQELGNRVELLQTTLAMKSDFHSFNVLNTGLKITALKRFRYKLLTYINAYLIAIWRLINSDFVYIYYPTNYQFLAIIAKLFGKQYGLNVRGQKGVESIMSKLLYRFSKTIFTVSPIFTEIATLAGAKSAHTQKPAISFDFNDIVYNRKYVKKSVYKLLFIGRLDSAKGIYELIDAIKLLKEERVNIELKIIGDGPELETTKIKVTELDLDNEIEFYGAITDPNLIKLEYMRADMFILPSYHEGFPRTVYEAMIFGTPIITTFVGGVPYLMIENQNCFRIEPKSIVSIQNQIRFVINNYDDVDRITRNARELVAEIISLDRLSHAEQLNGIINGK